MNMVFLSETINSPLVFFLDLGIILGGLGVVFFGKIIYSALFLGIVFVCVALIYLLLNADFLAAAQVLIYVGAINVLIVFAIMLINKPENETNEKQKTFGDLLSGFSVLGLFLFLINTIINSPWIKNPNPSGTQEALNGELEKVKQIFPEGPSASTSAFKSIDIIGIHLLTDLLLPFELLSILLLVALAGAITIARKDMTTMIEKN